MLNYLLENKNYVRLFENHRFTTVEKAVVAIEKYHIMDKKIMIDKLRGKEIGYKNLLNLDTINRDEMFEELEKNYKVLIHILNAESLYILIPLFADVDETEVKVEVESTLIANQISTRDVTIGTFYITPQTYRDEMELEYDANDYDYTFLLFSIIIDCARNGGSDIHFDVTNLHGIKEYEIRYRIDGRMYTQHKWKLTEEMHRKLCTENISKNTSAMDSKMDEEGVDTVISDVLGDGNFQVRPCVMPALNGYKMTIRIQKVETVSFRIEDLGFDEDIEDKLYHLSSLYHGITWITGKIRSGKNTTSMAMTNSMDREHHELLDLSSPIEILSDFPQVNYRDDAIGLANMLKRIKKSDVDLVVLNEIPSKDVAFGVRELAESSVGVITTTHLYRIWMLPHKLYSYYGEDYKDVLSEINGVITQKLLTQVCDCCPIVALDNLDRKDARVKKYLEEHGVSSFRDHRHKNPRCTKCNDGILKSSLKPYGEGIIFDEDIKKQIRTMDEPYEIEEFLKNFIRNSGKSLDDKICEGIQKGVLSYKEVLNII